MATSNVKTLPARTAPAPVAPPPSAAVAFPGSHNVAYEIEDDTLILMINISPAAIKMARLSKVNPQTGKGGNPVISTTGGFKFLGVEIDGKDLGVSLNIMAKDTR